MSRTTRQQHDPSDDNDHLPTEPPAEGASSACATRRERDAQRALPGRGRGSRARRAAGPGAPALEGYRAGRLRRRAARLPRRRAGGARGRLDARLGHARDRRLRAALGQPPPGRCACTCTASATPATSARCCARRRPSAPPASRSGPGCADPHSPKAVRASMGAIFSVRARARRRCRASCRASGSRCVADAPRACCAAPRGGTRRPRRPLTLLVGAEREGLPAERRRGLRAQRAHPDRVGVAERGDGGDGGAVRDDAGRRAAASSRVRAS